MALVGPLLQGLTQAIIKISTVKVGLRKDQLQVHSEVVGRIQVLWAVGLRASVSCCLVDRGHLQFLATWASPATSFITARDGKREKVPARKNSVFYNLISEMTSPNSCHILVVRRRS